LFLSTSERERTTPSVGLVIGWMWFPLIRCLKTIFAQIKCEVDGERLRSVDRAYREIRRGTLLVCYPLSQPARKNAHLFPNISMAVLVGDSGLDCEETAKHIRTTTDKVPIIFLTSRIAAKCIGKPPFCLTLGATGLTRATSGPRKNRRPAFRLPHRFYRNKRSA